MSGWASSHTACGAGCEGWLRPSEIRLTATIIALVNGDDTEDFGFHYWRSQN
jgi:hypothetical protein